MISRMARWHRWLRVVVAHKWGLPLHHLYNRVPRLEYGMRHTDITPMRSYCTGLVGHRAVHLSDLHLDRYLPRHDAVLAQVAALKPDWIFLTGDYVNVPDGMPHLERFLVALRAIAPVYMTLGNHDHYSGVPMDEFIGLADRHKLRLLINQVAIEPIGSTELCIVGLDDPSLHRADLNCLPPWRENRYILVLAHAPIILDLLKEEHRTNLVLCGHSHGGQWHFSGVTPFWLPYGCHGRTHGDYEKNGHRLYVNRGLGWSGFPARIACPPEIVLIEWVAERRARPSP